MLNLLACNCEEAAAMKDTFVHLVLGVALALMVGWILLIGRSIILPVVAGVVVAYIVLGLAELFNRLPGLAGRVPAALRYLLAVVVIGSGLVSIVWLIVVNVGEIAARLPGYQDQMLAAIQRGAILIGLDHEPSWDTIRRDMLAQINLQRTLGLTVLSALSTLATLAAIFVYAGFILIERGNFAAKIARLSDNPAQVAQIQELVRDVNNRIGVYLGMKTLINLGLAVLSYAVLRLWGIEFAGFWAILIGLFNYIPYLGGFIGVTPTVLVALLQLDGIGAVSAFLAAMIAAQVLLGNFIEPWLMGRSLNLSPFVILVSLVAWASIWGIPGAILSVPIMAILVILFSEFRNTRTLAILLSKNGELE